MRGNRGPPYLGDAERTVAELSVVTGISPDVLAGLDPDTFTALAHAAYVREGRWTHRDELAATTLETIHALYRLVARGLGVKARDLPRPLTYPRPDHVRRHKPLAPAATRQEIAARFSRGG